jgi:hypothetical protein
MSRRSLSPEFDPRIADWLEDDPDHAPEAVLETVVAAFPSIPQRRASGVPWRTRSMTMSMTSRLLAGAAAVAVVLVGGLFLLRPGGGSNVGASASPSASGSTPPTALVLDQTFVSDRYGYSVAYPRAWTSFQSSLPWRSGDENMWGSGINDEVTGPGIRFSGAAQALAGGQTADAWLRDYGSPIGALAGQGSGPADWPTVTIGGEQGWIDIDDRAASAGTVAPGGRIFDAVVVSGDYGFNFNMDGNVDRATFDAFLATVKLPAVPTLAKTYTSARAGYSIGYPASWSATPATKSWTTGYETKAFSDHIGTAPSIDGTSMKLPAATTFEAWFAGYDADRVKGTCGGPSLNEDITIDGSVGHLDIHCPALYIEAVVPKGDRVYVFTMFTPFNRPMFETLVGSVHLTPASAKN